MKLQSWNSYSCNNSSSFYLVAEFLTENLAIDVALELQEFFACHAKEIDVKWTANEEGQDVNEENNPCSSAQRKLGAKYNFEFSGSLDWGVSELVGNEPTVGVVANKLLVSHNYCAGINIHSYLRACGATEIDDDWGVGDWRYPSVVATFHLVPGEEGRAALLALDRFFNDGHMEDAMFWNDGEAGGAHMPLALDELETLKAKLSSPGIGDYRLVLGDDTNKARIYQLSLVSNCPECRSTNIKFMEADTNVSDDMFACRSCGGMFTLAAIAQLQSVTHLGDDALTRVVSVDDEVLLATCQSGAIWRQESGTWHKVFAAEVGLRGIVTHGEAILVCGEDGTILASWNGGTVWNTQKNTESGHLQGFTTTPNGRIWACGNGGCVLTSTDANSWTEVKVPTDQDIVAIAAASDDVLYFCVGTTVRGELFASKDGGESWRSQKLIQTTLCDILTLSTTDAIAVGRKGVVLRTNTGGRKWRTCPSRTKDDFVGIVRGNDGRVYALAGSTIFVSGDMGLSWEAHPTDTSKKLLSLMATQSGTMICVGVDGIVVQVDGLDRPQSLSPTNK